MHSGKVAVLKTTSAPPAAPPAAPPSAPPAAPPSAPPPAAASSVTTATATTTATTTVSAAAVVAGTLSSLSYLRYLFFYVDHVSMTEFDCGDRRGHRAAGPHVAGSASRLCDLCGLDDLCDLCDQCAQNDQYVGCHQWDRGRCGRASGGAGRPVRRCRKTVKLSSDRVQLIELLPSFTLPSFFFVSLAGQCGRPGQPLHQPLPSEPRRRNDHLCDPGDLCDLCDLCDHDDQCDHGNYCTRSDHCDCGARGRYRVYVVVTKYFYRVFFLHS